MTPPPAPAELPDRPALRPGLHVVRRDDRHLQVGVDPPYRLVVPDRPDVRRLLDDLAAGRPPAPSSDTARLVLADLVAARLVVDPHTDASRARDAAPVRVDGPADLRDTVRRLLEASRCVLASPTQRPAVALVMADGEIGRGVVDDLVGRDVPHLVVAAGVDGFRLGPFVVPGHTACLRCVDAHLGELDPRRAVVLEQVAGRRLPERATRRDPALLALVAACAARDVVRFVDGLEPSTWSATVEVGSAPLPRHQAWLRHPHCGCSWGDALDVG
ncbi:hypothetical protein [Nocardioides sp.]|uniref:hypothetical protein n=1 Tax=Nocardioides sp. TaxID=35761 RepID=UPI0031FE6054|nr:hypothetical protein [Nocardioides sp.]